MQTTLPPTLLGIPVVLSKHLAPDQHLLVSLAGRQTLLIPEPPGPVEIAFRDCRRAISRDCPTIAPPEWARLPDLAPPRPQLLERLQQILQDAVSEPQEGLQEPRTPAYPY